MSHSITVRMIANQEFEIEEIKVNIHDIETIIVNPEGVVVDAYLKTHTVKEGWLISETSRGGKK